MGYGRTCSVCPYNAGGFHMPQEANGTSKGFAFIEFSTPKVSSSGSKGEEDELAVRGGGIHASQSLNIFAIIACH
jgi:hypothetical protein